MSVFRMPMLCCSLLKVRPLADSLVSLTVNSMEPQPLIGCLKGKLGSPTRTILIRSIGISKIRATTTRMEENRVRNTKFALRTSTYRAPNSGSEPHTPTIAPAVPGIYKRWGSFSVTNASHRKPKLTYFRLNSQTPCPPRGAVPVNQERCRSFLTLNTRIAFGNGCDCLNYVAGFHTLQMALWLLPTE